MLPVSVVLSVSVETAMKCQMRVNDVLCAVSFEWHNHRCLVDCGKPSVVAIFWLPMPPAAIFAMAHSSCGDSTISHALYM